MSGFRGGRTSARAHAQQHRSAVARMRDACDARDAAGLARLLSRRVVLVVDAGADDVPAGTVHGRQPVAAAVLRLASRHPDASVEDADVNGMPGLAVRTGGQTVGVLSVSVMGRLIQGVWATTNPAKLTHWNRG